MVKIPASLGDLMRDPNISLTTSPFAPGKVIVKKSSFPKGQIPPHLVGRQIRKGECSGLRGTTIYKGKLVPKTAACVAQKRRK